MANEAERRDMLNELNASALSAYWQWAAAHAKYRFSKKGVGFAQLTFRLVKESFTSGFASELDTVEALSALLKRRMGLEKARMELSKTRYQLSSFLWGPDQLPILLSDDAFPVDIRKRSVPLLLRDSLDRMIQVLPSTSPALLAMQAKNADLMIQRKQLMQPVQDQIFTAVQEIATNRNYDFVFDNKRTTFLVLSVNLLTLFYK